MIVDCEFRIAERDESGKQETTSEIRIWKPRIHELFFLGFLAS